VAEEFSGQMQDTVCRVGYQKSGSRPATGGRTGYGAPSGAVLSLEVLVVWSFVYLALRRVLELMVLCWQSADAKR
jgi:hypothetical protein